MTNLYQTFTFPSLADSNFRVKPSSYYLNTVVTSTVTFPKRSTGHKPSPFSVFSLSTNISSYSPGAHAAKLFDEMRAKNGTADIVTFNTLLGGLCKNRKAELASDLISRLSSRDHCKPVLASYNAVIEGLSKAGKINEAVGLLMEMKGRGLVPDLTSYAALVAGLIREGRVDEAVSIVLELRGMGKRLNAAIYNSVILGLCKAKETHRAIDFYASMVLEERCMPTESTYMILIEGLVREGFDVAAVNLLVELYSRRAVKKSSMQNVIAGM